MKINTKIKLIIVSLILSAICPFGYTHTHEFLQNDIFMIQSLNVVWLSIVIWLTKEIKNRKNNRWIIYILPVLYSYLTYTDYKNGDLGLPLFSVLQKQS